MPNTTTALTAAGETYFADLGRVRASGGATGERSSYGPLANLLNAVGTTLAPKVFCVGELADQGAGHPDFGLYAAKQVQQGRPREGQVPERGVVEVKAAGDDAWLTAAGRSGEPLLGALPAGAGDEHARLRTGGRGCGGPSNEARNVPAGRRRGHVRAPTRNTAGHVFEGNLWLSAAQHLRKGAEKPQACFTEHMGCLHLIERTALMFPVAARAPGVEP